METTTTSHDPDTSSPVPPSGDPTDPRPDWQAATGTVAGILAAVTPDTLRHPTPCSEFDVEDLTRHLLSIGHRVLGIGRGQTAQSIPLDAPGVTADEFAAEWATTIETQTGEWADDRVLAKPMVLPFATLPGAAALAIYTAEIMIHAWDLATALGLEPAWDQDIAAKVLPVIQQGIPAEGRGTEMPFDPVVPTPDDAPAMDRLVAWVGRDPNRT